MRLSSENIEKKRANTSVLIRKADAFGAVIEAAVREESENDVLKRIDSIPPVAEANVAFLCDGRKCDSCSGECRHTLDVSHAKNFSKRDGAFFENEATLSAEAVQGEWGCMIADGSDGSHWYEYECSHCGEVVLLPYNFCPNCGAEMKGGDSE